MQKFKYIYWQKHKIKKKNLRNKQHLSVAFSISIGVYFVKGRVSSTFLKKKQKTKIDRKNKI